MSWRMPTPTNPIGYNGYGSLLIRYLRWQHTINQSKETQRHGRASRRPLWGMEIAADGGYPSGHLARPERADTGWRDDLLDRATPHRGRPRRFDTPDARRPDD